MGTAIVLIFVLTLVAFLVYRLVKKKNVCSYCSKCSSCSSCKQRESVKKNNEY